MLAMYVHVVTSVYDVWRLHTLPIGHYSLDSVVYPTGVAIWSTRFNLMPPRLLRTKKTVKLFSILRPHGRFTMAAFCGVRARLSPVVVLFCSFLAYVGSPPNKRAVQPAVYPVGWSTALLSQFLIPFLIFCFASYFFIFSLTVFLLFERRLTFSFNDNIVQKTIF